MVDAAARCASSSSARPTFAVPTLDALLAPATRSSAWSRSRIGRAAAARRPATPPVKARAHRGRLPVLQPERLKDAGVPGRVAALERRPRRRRRLREDPDRAVLATPRLGMINVHASLLPRYRGAAPIHRAVIAGDRETGVTIMRVVKALDAGPMLATVAPSDRSGRNQRGRRARPGALGAQLLSRRSIGWRPARSTEAAGRRRGDLRASPDQGRRHDRLDAAGRATFTT